MPDPSVSDSPTTSEQPEVLDQRRHNFSQIDNEVFDLYAEHIGPQGIALYCALVRFAHQDRDTFPSHASLGKKSGMSARSVQKYLPTLTNENPELAKNHLGPLVEIRPRYRPDGGQSSNLYILLPVAKAAPPPRQMPSDPPRNTFADDEYVTNKDYSVSPLRSDTGATALPRNGDAQTLVAMLYEDVLEIGKPTNYKQALGQASQLVKAGMTPDELRAVALWLLSDSFWSQKGVNMGTILSQRDKFRAAKLGKVTVRLDEPITPGPRGYTTDQLRRLAEQERRREAS